MMDSAGAGTLYLVHMLTHASRSKLDAALAHLELSSFQYTALSVLAHNENLSSSRLSRRFHVTPQAMGELILLLERRGLIERREDAANKRTLLLSLTEQGRAVWEQADVIAKTFERMIFGDLSDAQVRTLRSILGNALAVLRDQPIDKRKSASKARPGTCSRMRAPV
jgi:DNA-binding MarR family transcriptional regulator